MPKYALQSDSELIEKGAPRFADLLAEVRAAGLLERRIRWYVVQMVGTGGALLSVWAAFVLLGQSWWQVLIAGILGITTVHISFLAHDAGHGQIFSSRRANDIVGLVVGDFLTGVSYGWWNDKHRRHHTHPNREGRDPDIASPVIAFTPAAAAERRGLARAVGRYQVALVAVMLPAQSLVMRSKTIVFLLTVGGPYRGIETVGLLLHGAAYVTVVLSVLAIPEAIMFVAVHQAVFGVYMALVFAPNHKGMKIVGSGEDLDFLSRQVLTSRNVGGGRVIEFIYGCLNYQIEHHLFPSMPRPALHRVKPIVERYCKTNGIPYEETNAFASYRRVFGYLHQVGRRTTVPGPR